MKEKKDKIVLLTIIIVVFLFLALSKTLTSGFHFVDDHEIIRMHSELKSSSLTNVATVWVKEDLKSNIRFRPLYYIIRVFETRLFGSDFVLWSVFYGILCCITLISFYIGIRNLEFSAGESIAFLIITFIGPQSSIWWRLGPGESLGMLFLGFSFYFMSRCKNNIYFLTNSLLFILSLILASLTKESFLIIIPGMIYLKIWNEKTSIWTSLDKSVRKNLILILPLTVMIIELVIIKFYVGTGYAGLDSGFIDILAAITGTVKHFIRTYLNLVIVSLLIIGLRLITKKKFSEFDFSGLLFFLLLFVPNIVLYAKSGLVERYLIPSSLGLGFLCATFIKGISKNPFWLKKTIFVLILVSFLPSLIKSFGDAKKFSKEGRETNELLSAVSANYIKGSQVLTVVDPVEHYEKSVSLKSYLFYEKSIDLFGYCFKKDGNNLDYQGYADGWKSYFKGKQLEHMASAPDLIIFFDKEMIDKFFENSKLSQDHYSKTLIKDSSFAILKEISN
jgi:hypothetical protein